MSFRIISRPALACGFMTVALVTFGALAAPARQGEKAKATAIPPAKAEDARSVDTTLSALYDVISAPKGAKRDWDRFRSLFVPGARLIPALPDREGHGNARVLDVEQFVALVDPIEEGFFEKEIARKTESFGNIVHAFSTYESRRAKDDAKPSQRGINSIQLVKTGQGWRVVTIFWDAERPDNPIPEKYLPAR